MRRGNRCRGASCATSSASTGAAPTPGLSCSPRSSSSSTPRAPLGASLRPSGPRWRLRKTTG
eukprot:3534813-Lingulodinium_polyedra.AAC.1